MRRITFCLLAILFAAPALAQTNGTFLLLSSNTVSPTTPTTTIEVWATWFDPGAPQYYFGAANYDLEAGDGEFVSGTLVLGNDPPNTMGVLSGRMVTGAAMGQILFCDPFACPYRNPILLATYDWTTTDFTPRTVDLSTSNTNNFVVSTPLIPGPQIVVQLYPDEFTAGSGVIIVESGGSCYADCDRSGGLDIFDFLCFQNSFVSGEPYACDCDITTGTNPPVCDIFDFLCFQNAFVAGCP